MLLTQGFLQNDSSPDIGVSSAADGQYNCVARNVVEMESKTVIIDIENGKVFCGDTHIIMNITYACSPELLNSDFFNFNYIKGFVDVDTSNVVYLRFTSETTKTVAIQLGFALEQMVFQYYSTLVRTYLDV